MGLRFRAALFAAVAFLVSFPAKGHVSIRRPVRRSVAPTSGVSVGSPSEGHLLGGTHLEATPYLRIVPADSPGDVRWGLRPLVGLIDRAARKVNQQFPGSVTSVGHLSRHGGGDVSSHHSHESGRDADVSFFIRDNAGRPLAPQRFVRFGGDAQSPDWPGARFDDARNWAFVTALLNDPEARVTHIFVSDPLRARLLSYAQSVHAPWGTRARAAWVMHQPTGGLPHDNHFHVRIACPPHMAQCVESPPHAPVASRKHRMAVGRSN